MPTCARAPLRLHTRALSCGSLYAGQSFMAKQQAVKLEQPRENVEEEIKAIHLHLCSTPQTMVILRTP